MLKTWTAKLWNNDARETKAPKLDVESADERQAATTALAHFAATDEFISKDGYVALTVPDVDREYRFTVAEILDWATNSPDGIAFVNSDPMLSALGTLELQ